MHDLPSFAETLPRIYDLIAATDLTRPNAYFHDFESRFLTGRTVLSHYQKLERQLAALDSKAWVDLRRRAAQVSHSSEAGRGWSQMFDVFNEGIAYGYLLLTGCTDIYFIQRAKHSTADLAAVRGGRPLICEVKTIHPSANAAANAARVQRGEIFTTSVPAKLSAAFMGKLNATLERAAGQILATPGADAADHMIFTILRFDDWVGDYQDRYFAQIDDHLLANPFAGVDLVFYPAADLFGRTFKMKSATVYMG